VDSIQVSHRVGAERSEIVGRFQMSVTKQVSIQGRRRMFACFT